jgi:sn-glycerol 3-phosphate transport system permease protein
LIASISCAFIWTWLYNKNDYGLFNTVLKLVGIPPQSWLNDSSLAMNCVIIMNVWKSIGYYALIVLAALKSIPTEIYEAAKLDNTSPMRTFFKITLPMLSPQIFFMLITITTGSFKVFDSMRIMTGGGPGDSTRVLSMYIYDYAFQRNNSLGIGAAAGVVLLIILILITLLDFKGLERKVHYQ